MIVKYLTGTGIYGRNVLYSFLFTIISPFLFTIIPPPCFINELFSSRLELNMNDEVELRWRTRHPEAVWEDSSSKGTWYPHYFSTEVIETHQRVMFPNAAYCRGRPPISGNLKRNETAGPITIAEKTD